MGISYVLHASAEESARVEPFAQQETADAACNCRCACGNGGATVSSNNNTQATDATKG